MKLRQQSYSLQVLADYIHGQVGKQADLAIGGMASLKQAGATDLAFFANTKYKEQLQKSTAGAVLICSEHAALLEGLPIVPIITANPYAAFAKLSALFAFERNTKPSIHPSALIHSTARIGSDVFIGPNVVIEADVHIGDRCQIEAGSYIGYGADIGADSVVDTGVHIHHDVQIGVRCRIHSGAVIGSEGFGFAPMEHQWQRIVHLGSVRMGDDVRIGANTTIDRGALEDTHIGDHVIIDNQVQIAHNVNIGNHTAIAANTGIAGSTSIGQRCVIGGCVAITGHITICDRVHITGATFITKSISKPGSYSSGSAFSETVEWRKAAVIARQLPKLQLDKLPNQLKSLQQRIEQLELQLKSSD